MKKLFSPLLNPYIGPIIVVSTVILTLVLFIIPKYSHQNNIDQIHKRSVEIVTNLKKTRSYYTNSVIDVVKNNSNIKINYDHKNGKNTIPLPATLVHDLSALISDNGMEIKMLSDYPFPNRANRILNTDQKESLSYLINNPNEIFIKEVERDGEKRLNVVVPDIFYDNSCVSCHNTRADTPKSDWKIGDVRGVIEITSPINSGIVLTSPQVIVILFVLIVLILALGVHYLVLSIKRTKEHEQAKSDLENIVHERTYELQQTIKLLNQYKNAVDLSAIVSKTDKKGKITYINDEFMKISKYSENELLGNNHSIVRHKDMPFEVFEDLWKTIQSKKVWKGQIKNRAKDGTAYYVMSTIVPILNYENEIEEFLAIRLDISSIVESQNKAKRADEAKSTFLANMSHEIRTPLNAIIGFSDLLSTSGDLTTKNKKQSQIIHSSAKSLLSIINDILDVSKIENGNFEVTIEETDLYLISEHVVELFSKKANEKHIKFIFDIDNKIPLCVLTDGSRLKQVLSNLLSNAIKFTEEKGKVSLILNYLEAFDNSKVKIRFEIRDNGIGIPEDKLLSIFNPFIQVDHKSNREFQGTGLGLSICTHIVESLGSKISVESSVGSGTKFYFDLDFDICEDSNSPSKDYINSLNFKITDIESDIYHYAKRYLNIFGTINANEKIDLVVHTCTDKSFDSLEGIRAQYKDIPMLILYEYEENLNMFKLKSNEQAIALPFYASKLNDSLEELLRKTNKKEILSKEIINSEYKGNILIAEDNSANQELISYILDGMGLNFVIKNNGEEVLTEFKNNSYDLVLMDINMPIMDGIEAFKQIRDYEKKNSLKETAVIALTANAIKGDREKFLSLGMNDYLSKPINVDDLKKVFKVYLDDKQESKINNIKKVESEKSEELQDFNSLIDIEKLIKRLGISENIAQIIIKKFKSDIHNDIKELEKYIESNDIENISEKAHYIKNSCLNVALDEVCELLQNLEDKSIDMDLKKSIFMKLKKLINRV